MQTPEIKAALDQMRDCAAAGFYAAEQFGKGSPEHVQRFAVFSAAQRQYETLCKSAGVAPYATYDGD